MPPKGGCSGPTTPAFRSSRVSNKQLGVLQVPFSQVCITLRAPERAGEFFSCKAAATGWAPSSWAPAGPQQWRLEQHLSSKIRAHNPSMIKWGLGRGGAQPEFKHPPLSSLPTLWDYLSTWSRRSVGVCSRHGTGQGRHIPRRSLVRWERGRLGSLEIWVA